MEEIEQKKELRTKLFEKEDEIRTLSQEFSRIKKIETKRQEELYHQNPHIKGKVVTFDGKRIFPGFDYKWCEESVQHKLCTYLLELAKLDMDRTLIIGELDVIEKKIEFKEKSKSNSDYVDSLLLGYSVSKFVSLKAHAPILKNSIDALEISSLFMDYDPEFIKKFAVFNAYDVNEKLSVQDRMVYSWDFESGIDNFEQSASQIEKYNIPNELTRCLYSCLKYCSRFAVVNGKTRVLEK